jgi:hypothetical protein
MCNRVAGVLIPASLHVRTHALDESPCDPPIDAVAQAGEAVERDLGPQFPEPFDRRDCERRGHDAVMFAVHQVEPCVRRRNARWLREAAGDRHNAIGRGLRQLGRFERHDRALREADQRGGRRVDAGLALPVGYGLHESRHGRGHARRSVGLGDRGREGRPRGFRAADAIT